MRLLGRLLLLVVLLPPFAWALWLGGTAALGLVRDPEAQDQLADVDRTLAYELDRDRWTTFPLAGGPDRVRLVLQAALPEAVARAEPATEGAERIYAVAYEIVAADGRVLAEGLRHGLAAVELCRDPLTGDLASSVSYLEGGLQPTLAKVTVLDLSGQPGAAGIRVRLASHDPEVDHVVARIYERVPLADFRVRSSWQRLSDRQRARLASEVGLPVALLNEAERADLLRNRWHPVGPQGLEGSDYLVRALYVRPGGCDDPVGEPTLAPGFYADALRHALIPIPPGADRLTLFVEPPVGEDEGPKAGTMELRWHGLGPGLPLAGRARWSTAEGGIELPVRGVALEVIPDRPLVLSVRSSGEGVGEAEIAPRPLLVRMAWARPGAPITFPVAHVGDEATPLRLQLRCLCGREETVPARRRVDYELLGADGSVVGSGSLEAALGPAPFEQVQGEPEIRVLGPAFAHFNLPLAVRAIRVAGPLPFLVAASNRPPGAPASAAMPALDADLAAQGPAPDDARLWFPLRPQGWREIIESDGSPSILVQEQVVPPEAQVLVQLLNWEPWDPVAPRPRFEVLAPFGRRPGLPSAFGADVFMPLTAGQPNFFDILPLPGESTVQPELLILPPDGGLTGIGLHLDGRPAPLQSDPGTTAPLRLPSLAPRWHFLESQWSGPDRPLVAQADPTAEAWIRRRAIRLVAEEEVSLSYDKRREGREFLVVHVFPVGAGARQLDVEIGIGHRSLGPLPDWTPRLWRADFGMGSGTREAALRLPDERLGAERVVLIPLGADLPPGRYSFRLRLEGAPGYLAFTRTGPDPAAQAAAGPEGAIGSMDCALDPAGAWACGAAPP